MAKLDLPDFTRNDTEGQLETIWQALFVVRDHHLPEGDPEADRQWDEITTAMAFITEDLRA